MWNSKHVDDLVRQLVDAIPPGIKAIPLEAEKNFKGIVHGAFSKLDLVTREEFDAQVASLQQTRRKLETMEQELQMLLDRNKESD